MFLYIYVCTYCKPMGMKHRKWGTVPATKIQFHLIPETTGTE